MTRIYAILTNQTLRVRNGWLIIGLWWDDDNYKYLYWKIGTLEFDPGDRP